MIDLGNVLDLLRVGLLFGDQHYNVRCKMVSSLSNGGVYWPTCFDTSMCGCFVPLLIHGYFFCSYPGKLSGNMWLKLNLINLSLKLAKHLLPSGK